MTMGKYSHYPIEAKYYNSMITSYNSTKPKFAEVQTVGL